MPALRARSTNAPTRSRCSFEISGPISVVGLSGSPTRIFLTCETKSSTKSLYLDFCT